MMPYLLFADDLHAVEHASGGYGAWTNQRPDPEAER
jgi:hypothetical protein